mmetsp:Transcript_17286/g.25855  ORF Transcript_17286/g.25855 Transcript_17286/m.25855 type:complete len:274 (-) Transcript_17286:382-1203(-)
MSRKTHPIPSRRNLINPLMILPTNNPFNNFSRTLDESIPSRFWIVDLSYYVLLCYILFSGHWCHCPSFVGVGTTIMFVVVDVDSSIVSAVGWIQDSFLFKSNDIIRGGTRYSGYRCSISSSTSTRYSFYIGTTTIATSSTIFDTSSITAFTILIILWSCPSFLLIIMMIPLLLFPLLLLMPPIPPSIPPSIICSRPFIMTFGSFVPFTTMARGVVPTTTATIIITASIATTSTAITGSTASTAIAATIRRRTRMRSLFQCFSRPLPSSCFEFT